MNKRILFSSLSILASAAVVTGATFAFFSDSETSTGNTFTAGRLDLTVDGHNNPGTLVTLTAKPSEQLAPTTITLRNSGSNGGIADLHFQGVTDGQGTGTEPECVAEHGQWSETDGACAGPTPIDNVSTKIGVDIGYDLDGSGAIEDNEYLIWTDVPGTPSGGVINAGELSWGTPTDTNKIVATLAQLNSVGFDLGHLSGGDTRQLKLSFHLKADTDNEYQGDVSTFDIEFTLHQVNDTTSTNIVPSGIPTPTPT